MIQSFETISLTHQESRHLLSRLIASSLRAINVSAGVLQLDRSRDSSTTSLSSLNPKSLNVWKNGAASIISIISSYIYTNVFQVKAFERTKISLPVEVDVGGSSRQRFTGIDGIIQVFGDGGKVDGEGTSGL